MARTDYEPAELLAKAAEYEFLAAMAPDKETCRVEREKMRHYIDMANEDSAARFVRDVENLVRDQALHRANSAEREARKRIKLNASKIETKDAVVVSPYLNPDIKGQQTEKVKRNIRHDVLEYEHAHKRISDIQKAAGDRFLALYEQAGIGGAQAIDYSNPRVDGRSKADAMRDSVLVAQSKLRDIAYILGQEDFGLMVRTVCEGVSLRAEANSTGKTGWKARKAHTNVSGFFCRALDVLAKHFGMVVEQRDKSRIRADVTERTSHRPDLWETHVPLHQCG